MCAKCEALEAAVPGANQSFGVAMMMLDLQNEVTKSEAADVLREAIEARDPALAGRLAAASHSGEDFAAIMSEVHAQPEYKTYVEACRDADLHQLDESKRLAEELNKLCDEKQVAHIFGEERFTQLAEARLAVEKAAAEATGSVQ